MNQVSFFLSFLLSSFVLLGFWFIMNRIFIYTHTHSPVKTIVKDRVFPLCTVRVFYVSNTMFSKQSIFRYDFQFMS